MLAGKPIPLKSVERNGYSLIKNHGMICSNRTAALVSMNGTIDWACMPNFNSNPVFCSILDREKGGFFSIAPSDSEDYWVMQHYHDHTNILITEFSQADDIILRLTDFIPTSEYSTINFPEIHRYIEVPFRSVQVSIRIRPVFDFMAVTPDLRKQREGYLFQAGAKTLGVSSEIPMKMGRDSLFANLTLKKGDHKRIVVMYGVKSVQRVWDYKTFERMEETSEYWKNWVSNGHYPALYNRETIRSALILKGLFYEPSGLMVAAPTSSLPESVGGERNWDYRYAWIRDTAYVVESLSLLGYKREAVKFLYDIMEIVKRQKNIKTIYQIDGKTSIEEYTVDFSGYLNSSPVRMGNAAVRQLQIDEYGSIVNAIYYAAMANSLVNSYLWDFLIETLKKLSKIWYREDSSIWEFRTKPRHYTYSKAVAYVAFTRAIEIGRRMGFSGPYSEWHETAEMIKESILTNAVDSRTGSLVQYYGAKHTDAALLRLPHFGILPPDHEVMRATIERIEKELMTRDYLFLRYRNPDGFKSKDNAFTLLSFWYVEDLVLMKERDRAREVFEHLLKLSNHLGLYSEEIEPETGDHVGNFPQAMSHLGLIRAAKSLNEVFRGRTQSSRNIIQ